MLEFFALVVIPLFLFLTIKRQRRFSGFAPTRADRPAPATFQFTIGWAMIVIALFAIFLALTRFWIVGVVILAIYAVYRIVRRLSAFAPLDPDQPGPAKLQFTLAQAMIVFALVAIVSATTGSGLATAVMFAPIAFYDAVCRYVLPGPALPQRLPTDRTG
jgi:hypothetical protein